MKVIMKITENSYSKTVIMNDGAKLIEKWERSGNGFSQTKNSISFEDSILLEETKEALDFNFMELCDAIENESAAIYDDGEIPKTDDGVFLKRGDSFFTVASTISAGKFICVPLKLKFPLDWGSHGSTCYSLKEKCIEECDKRNASE
jgi:hypothetical protein